MDSGCEWPRAQVRSRTPPIAFGEPAVTSAPKGRGMVVPFRRQLLNSGKRECIVRLLVDEDPPRYGRHSRRNSVYGPNPWRRKVLFSFELLQYSAERRILRNGVLIFGETKLRVTRKFPPYRVLLSRAGTPIIPRMTLAPPSKAPQAPSGRGEIHRKANNSD